MSDCNQGTNVDLPFTFNYAGVDYNRIRICSNGWIGLGEISHNSNEHNLASTSCTRILAPLWNKIINIYEQGYLGDITYKVVGEAPSRILIIQFKNLDLQLEWSYLTTTNFQVMLYEYGGFISFHYGPVQTEGYEWYQYLATIGINGLLGGINDFISVTPSTTATVSSEVSNNMIGRTDLPFLTNKKYSFIPTRDYVNLVFPANNEINVFRNTFFDWEDIDGYTTYQIQVAETHIYKSLLN